MCQHWLSKHTVETVTSPPSYSYGEEVELTRQVCLIADIIV